MKRILGAAFLIFCAMPIQARVISWTGAELLNDPRVSFPSTAPVQNGSSIELGAGGAWDKLLQFDVHPAPRRRDLTIEITMNATRLTGDWDPYIGLTDGTHMIMVPFFDNLGGGAGVYELFDLGDAGTPRFPTTDILSGAGFPDIGESVDLMAKFSLKKLLTEVEASLLGSTASLVTGTVLDRRNLAFVFMRDNEGGERYRVNSLGITIDVPEPGALSLLVIAVIALGLRNSSVRLPH